MSGWERLGLESAVGVFGLIIFLFFGGLWALWRRSKYQKETINKIKCVYFSEGASVPEVMVLDILSNGVEVQAPRGHRISTYFINRKATFYTLYPEKPIMGLWFIQVPILTQWWDRDNPEPLTSYKHEAVATPEAIFNSNDTNYMFALRQAKNELEAGRKELLKAQANKLNANAVYLFLGVNTLGLIIIGIFVMKYGADIIKIMNGIGVK